MLGYSNDVNPFGDSNLLQPFVWKKKIADGKGIGKNKDDDRLEMISEIEKVRKRRKDREEELAQLELLRSEEQRLREAASYQDWEQKEEVFHIEQIAERSKLRLLGTGRCAPVDYLAKNILIEKLSERSEHKLSKSDSKFLELDLESTDPCTIVEDTLEDELQQLIQDIDMYIQLEQRSTSDSLRYWQSIRTLVIAKQRSVASREHQDSFHKEIKLDVQELIKGKTYEDLDLLQRDIEKNIREGVNAEYWEDIMKEVIKQRAERTASTFHEALLEKLRKIFPDKAKSSRSSVDSGSKYTESNFMDEITEDVMIDDAEITLASQTYQWKDKFEPRKPRYFNRVKTGWDRTKYNLTHYDSDNPPPKMIQGYKFTIFYPDLIDKTKTPRYYIEPCDSNDFVILRFHAGAPYEDIGFKIVNREWDIHRHSGFRSVFEKGILQLHFNFKRTFYRR